MPKFEFHYFNGKTYASKKALIESALKYIEEEKENEREKERERKKI